MIKGIVPSPPPRVSSVFSSTCQSCPFYKLVWNVTFWGSYDISSSTEYENMCRKLRAKVNPQNMAEPLEAWSAHFFMQALYTRSQASCCRTRRYLPGQKAHPWFCEPSRLFWAVSSLVVMTVQWQVGVWSHLNAIFTWNQVQDCFLFPRETLTAVPGCIVNWGRVQLARRYYLTCLAFTVQRLKH